MDKPDQSDLTDNTQIPAEDTIETKNNGFVDPISMSESRKKNLNDPTNEAHRAKYPHHKFRQRNAKDHAIAEIVDIKEEDDGINRTQEFTSLADSEEDNITNGNLVDDINKTQPTPATSSEENTQNNNSTAQTSEQERTEFGKRLLQTLEGEISVEEYYKDAHSVYRDDLSPAKRTAYYVTHEILMRFPVQRVTTAVGMWMFWKVGDWTQKLLRGDASIKNDAFLNLIFPTAFMENISGSLNYPATNKNFGHMNTPTWSMSDPEIYSMIVGRSIPILTAWIGVVVAHQYLIAPKIHREKEGAIDFAGEGQVPTIAELDQLRRYQHSKNIFTPLTMLTSFLPPNSFGPVIYAIFNTEAFNTGADRTFNIPPAIHNIPIIGDAIKQILPINTLGHTPIGAIRDISRHMALNGGNIDPDLMYKLSESAARGLSTEEITREQITTMMWQFLEIGAYINTQYPYLDSNDASKEILSTILGKVTHDDVLPNFDEILEISGLDPEKLHIGGHDIVSRACEAMMWPIEQAFGKFDAFKEAEKRREKAEKNQQEPDGKTSEQNFATKATRREKLSRYKEKDINRVANNAARRFREGLQALPDAGGYADLATGYPYSRAELQRRAEKLRNKDEEADKEISQSSGRGVF